MNKMIRNCLICLLLGTFAVIVLPANAAAIPYVLGELVIKMSPGHEVQEIHNQFGTVPAQHLEQLDIHLINAGSSTDLDSLSALIEATGLVEFCQPNYRIDPLQPVQSSLPVSDELGEGSFADQSAATRLELSSAHQYATGTAIRVAVLDGGIDYTHPALAGVASSGYDYVTDDFDAMDEPGGPNSGHGTFVSGVVHLVAPSAEIRAYRVTDLNGESNGYQVAEAIMQAVNDSCRIINLSMVTMAEHAAMVDAIAYASANDVLVVVAAGNGHDGGTAYPASDPNAFAVAAIDTTDQLADFSNYGDYVDICAPGTEIYSAYLDHGYAWWGGTSFAAPFVTAQAALLLDFNPEATRQDVIDAISATAEDIYDANGEYVGQLGAGLIDPLESLIAIRNGTVSISVPGDYATIQAAVDAALIGDTILVGPGTYTESIVIAQKLVYLMSTDGPDNTILQTPDSNQRTVQITNIALGELVVRGFTFVGPCSVPLLDVFNSDVKVRDCRFTKASSGTYNLGAVWADKSSLDIAQCSFYDNESYAALGFFPEHKWAILTARNNTFHRSERAIDIRTSGYLLDTVKATIVSNIITETDGYGVYCNLPITRGAYNLFFDNDYDYHSGVSGSLQNSIFQDPLYLLPNSVTLWLQLTSPAIDAGDPDPMQNDPDGSRNDIGAFPLGSGYPAPASVAITGEQGDDLITTLTPEFSWQYQDIGGQPQTQYHVQVGSDNDWTTAELWDSGPVSSAATAVPYAGPALQDLTTYYYRVRVFNGDAWGPWNGRRFVSSFATTIRVPLDSPSIMGGVVLASVGDTVLVAAGDYPEDVVLPDRQMNLFAEDGPAATSISGSRAIYIATDSSASPTIIRGFTLNAYYTGVRVVSGSVWLDSINFVGAGSEGIFAFGEVALKVTQCTFDSCHEPILTYGGSSSNVSVRHSVFKHNYGGQLLRFDQCTKVDFQDNLAYDNSGERFLYVTSIDTLVMINNTIANNDVGYAIQLYGSPFVTFFNNLVAFNRDVGVYLPGAHSTWDVRYNNSFGHDLNYSGLSDSILNLDNLELHPLFVDLAAGDLSLSLGSPCIDAGHPDPVYNDPDGSRSDIGAIPNLETVLYPIASNILVTPVDADGYVRDTFPTFDWMYEDTTGGSQVECQIQVGTDYDWTTVEIWDSGPITTGALSLPYTGPALDPVGKFVARVRLSNGSTWGSWHTVAFHVHTISLIRVPDDMPTIAGTTPALIDGDTLLVGPGVYSEPVNLYRRSVWLLSEYGPDSTFITAPPGSPSAVRMVGGIADRVTISGFTISGGDTCMVLRNLNAHVSENVLTGARHLGLAARQTPDSVIIERNVIADNAQGIYVYARYAVVQFEHNQVRDNDSTGAGYIYASGDTSLIRYNQFLRNKNRHPSYPQNGSLSVYGNRMLIHHNSFYADSARDGALDIASYQTVDVRNNIVAFSGRHGITAAIVPDQPIFFNNVYASAGYDYIDLYPDSGSLSADPMFANPANNDLSLLAGSPCIDAGDPGLGPVDPDMTLPDMGAIPYRSGTSPVVTAVDVLNEDPTHILDSLPTIVWSWIDSLGGQSAYEIQVSEDLIWDDSTDWLPGVVNSSDTEAVYAGLPLARAIDYAVRVRLFNGTTWGPWAGRLIRRNGLASLTAYKPTGDFVALEIFLEASNDPDPDGDSLWCDFELYGDSLMTQPVSTFYNVPGRRSPVISGLAPDTYYWWRTRGFDGYEYSEWSDLRQFKTARQAGRVVINPPVEAEIACGQDVSIVLNVWNNATDSVSALVNGFRIYSPDGAVFDSVSGSWLDSAYDWSQHFDLLQAVESRYGSTEDTIGFVGIRLFRPALPPDFYSPAFKLTTRLECTDIGKALCVDKSVFGLSNNVWQWWMTQGPGMEEPVVPEWDGPFCFIIEDCCVDTRGDINGDGTNANMTDLTYLVAYLFQGGPPPPCFSEANINGDIAGALTITDVTMLVNSMFVTFDPLPGCDEARLAPPTSLAAASPVVMNLRYERDTTIITVASTTELLGLHLRLVGGEGTTPRLLTDGPFSLFHNFEDNTLTLGLLDIHTGAALAAGSQDVISLAGHWEIADAFAADRHHRDIVATISVVNPLIPSHYELAQNYPNPFNPSTTIKFGLPVITRVRLEIINILGQRVALLTDREYEAGYHEVVWDGSSASGQMAASGVYFYRLRANGFEQSKKMMLLK